jgi:NAD-dependent dihydropyrimidine dehydrogenase PreA subunit
MNLLPRNNLRDQLPWVNVMAKVTVDVSKCNGDSICADVCPVAVFELKEVAGFEGKKSVVVNNDACIACRACEVQCPTQAIVVNE